MWMVALGERIAAQGSVPVGVPFAAADTNGWPNVPVLGELLMYAVHSFSPVGLAVALLGITAATLLLLGGEAVRAGTHPTAVAIALAFVGAGLLPTFGVVRAQMLSLLPYALLVLLLRAESRHPTNRIWLAVPLIALWGNLHGGVLVGVAITGCYLALSRLRSTPITALLVGIAALLSVWANPALLRTGHYYLGVLSNEAARRGTELWARPDLGSTFDLLMITATMTLGLTALLRGRLKVWELCAVLGMAAATVTSARHAMWLLLFLVAPGAIGLSRLAPARRAADRSPSASTYDASEKPRRTGRQLLVPGLALSLSVVAVVSLFGREVAIGGPVETVRTISALAGGRVVLAPEPLAEDLTAAGVTVWASNPIDAFRPEDQAAYLDVWLGHEGGRRAIDGSDLVVAAPNSLAHRLAMTTGCTEVGRATDFAILECAR